MLECWNAGILRKFNLGDCLRWPVRRQVLVSLWLDHYILSMKKYVKTRICLRQTNGFTLIELIVVISLISIITFVSVPRFHNKTMPDNTKKVSRWIMITSQSLKEKSFSDQKLYTMYVDMESRQLWVTDESMSEEEVLKAGQQGFLIPDDVEVLDVEFPGNNKIISGLADICFYPDGHSDMALIHIKDDDNNRFSFLIEPFLSKVKLYEKYSGFEG
jgi:prepilin-type N-terminal cleavage/methylation domain-containing protein